jgi:hypothetical protein
MHRHARARRSTIWRRLSCVTLLAGLIACSRNPSTTDSRQPSDTVRKLQAFEAGRRQVATNRVSALRIFRGSPIPGIPEYNDEQRLVVANHGNFEFGSAIAHAYAIPGTENLRGAADFEAEYGSFVAVVLVDSLSSGNTLQPEYGDLHLVPNTLHCVYLKHEANQPEDRNWQAFLLPASSSTTCDPPTAPGSELAVEFRRDAQFSQQDDYPPVVRFGRGVNGRPLIAVRCGNAVCWIGSGPVLPPISGHAGSFLDNTRAGRIALWHDEQMLAISSGAGGLSPRHRSSVVPFPGIGSKHKPDFLNVWVKMAWIWFEQDPAGSKYGVPTPQMPKTWGMKAGPTLLEIRFDSVTNAWEGRLTSYTRQGEVDGGPMYSVTVVQAHPHGYDLPGSVRFNWLTTDEGVWVPCDQGCCQVDAMVIK